MTMDKDSGVQARTPPKHKQSPAKKARRKLSPDNGEVIGSGSAPEVVNAVHGEFTEAFDLTGISEELQEKMFTVAPLLRGRCAAYSKSFFTDVVGLCGEGLPLSKVHVPEHEIQVKWPIKNSRYEIVDCLDSDEAALFYNQWAKVYGESPDNAYFSARFLKGCYATFVHSIKVNWAEEALERRRQREEKRAQNPYKLGPVALQQQIAALCKLIQEIEASPGRSMKNLERAKGELQQCEEDEVRAINRKCELLQQLNDAKEGLESCCTDSGANDLNGRYSIAAAEANSLRSKGDFKGSSAKRVEAQALLDVINETTKKTTEFESAIVDIEEGLLPEAMVELRSTQESVAKAKKKIMELTMCPGCKDAMAEPVDSADAAAHPLPISPLNAVADVHLASPPKAEADALPANSPKRATETVLGDLVCD